MGVIAGLVAVYYEVIIRITGRSVSSGAEFQEQDGSRGQSSNHSLWLGFWMNHCLLNILVKADPVAVIC